jgi:phage terminase large subunit-like protein
MTHVDRANDYIARVLSGDVPACKWVRLACERQRNDLASPPGGYRFDINRAERVCRFIEMLPHIKGEWSGKQMRLEPWQSFVLTTAFGWVGEDGRRRFKTTYVEIPRKNGKSLISTGVALYMLAADGEGGAEVYSAATTRDQARIVWDDAKRMVERSEGLRKLGVGASAHAIHLLREASTFRALSRDQGGNLDGLNVHCAVVDELHAHKTRDVWDVLETATGARRQPMLWAITTAGFNRAGVCFEVRTYLQKILSGAHDDPEFFGVIWGIDDTDKWDDPAVWQKANPNWGVSVKPDDIARKARKAMEMSAATNNFLTKHLNVWVNADTAWMDMRKWGGCEDDLLTLDEFEGQPCWIGIDLASKIDIAEVSLVFERAGNLYVFNRHYLNEDATEDGRNSQYSGWAADGRLTVTPGNVTDYAYIESDLEEIARRFNVRAIGYDPWQAVYLANRLNEKGLPMVEVRQTVQNMSEPMKYLQAMVYSGKLRHDGDPVLSWMVSNVVAHLDAKENIYPRKQSPENKIDGVVALVMALGRHINERNDAEADISDWISSPVIR